MMTLKAQLIAAGIAALALLSLLSAMLWYRGEALRYEGERDVAIAQVNVLASAVNACNASVDSAKSAADAATKLGQQLLADAKARGKRLESQIATLDEALRRPPPPNANCDSAWDIIERAAEVKP